MKRLRPLLSGIALLTSAASIWMLSSLPGSSQQLSTDQTVGTTVKREESNQRFMIEGGSLRNNSLFHSFETFSPEDWSTVFDLSNATYSDVNFVIGRVTGRRGSYINGGLEILGGNAPDLLLINPSGIAFGPDASLQIDGSFVASTAESALFDQYAFSALNPEAVPSLLSVSVPTGLQIGGRSRPVELIGKGHQVFTIDPIFTPYSRLDVPSGLVVEAGETLALVGSEIQLSGAVLTAPGGRIELGGVANGRVDIDSEENGLRLGYSAVDTYGDVALSARSLADVGGDRAGSIQVQGHTISLDNGSALWSQNRGISAAGDIAVTASESVTIDNDLPDIRILSGIAAETVFLGDSGDVVLHTPKLTVQSGTILGSRTFSPGDSGDVLITANDVGVRGYAAAAADIFTRVGSSSYGAGQAGNIQISTQRLLIQDGGYVGSSTLQDGRGGDVTVKASDIIVDGVTPTGAQSLLVALTIGGKGDAGNIAINTDRLSVTNSGFLVTSSYSDGDAGNITIDATEQVIVSGRTSNLPVSAISSGVRLAPPIYQQLTGASQTPTGAAGNLSLSVPHLLVDRGGAVNVANLGLGDAGTLLIQADTVNVSDGGNISALTTSGAKGNIVLQADVLNLRRGALLQATSLGEEDGGNINLDTRFLIGLENSDVVANAVTGNGGNINIVTQGIFGLAFRDRLTPENDITASSESGLEGTVEIANTGLAENTGITVLPVYFSDADNQVAAECGSTGQNQFVASGRGGLQNNPGGRLFSNRLWQDLRHSSAQPDSSSSSHTALDVQLNETVATEIVEATGWQRSETGQIELGAIASSQTNPLSDLLCLANAKQAER